jgi:hypothetical protein
MELVSFDCGRVLMPVEVSWLHPERITFIRLYGVVSLNEIKDLVDEVQDRLNNAEAPIHFITDISGIGRYEIGLSQLRSLFAPLHRSSGWTVIYGSNKIIRFFASVLFQLYRGKLYFVDTYDEALAYILQVDPSCKDIGAESGQN